MSVARGTRCFLGALQKLQGGLQEREESGKRKADCSGVGGFRGTIIWKWKLLAGRGRLGGGGGKSVKTPLCEDRKVFLSRNVLGSPFFVSGSRKLTKEIMAMN